MKYLAKDNNYVAQAAEIIYDADRKGWTAEGVLYSDFDGTMYAVVDTRPPKDSSDIIMERNRRLAASDWTQYPKSTVDKTAWEIYRQALRDLPEQADFPYEFIWPNPPPGPLSPPPG
jgi:hypothetical protein